MFLAWVLLAVSAASKAAAASCHGPALEGGLALRASLSEGQVPSFRLEVPAGHLARVVVNQGCTDFVVEVVTETGERLAFDTPNGPQGPEVVELLAEGSGHFCLEVPHSRGQPAGTLEILLESVRPATDEDRRRLAARRRATEAYRGLDLRRSPLCRGNDCQAALERWREAGQLDWQSYFELELARVAEGEAAAKERLARAYALAKQAANPYLLHQVASQLAESDPYRLEGFATAAEAWARVGCRPERLRSLHGAAIAARKLGRSDRAEAFLADSFEVARSLEDPAALAETWMLEGVHRMAKPEPPERALAAYREAAGHLEKVSHPARRRELENELTASRAVALYYQGDTDQALIELEGMLRRLVASGDPTARSGELGAGPGELGAYFNLGSLFLTFGAVDKAQLAYARGLQLAESGRAPAQRVRFAIGLATARRQADRDQEARELYLEASRLAEDGGADQAAALRGLGVLELKAGRLEPAARYLDQAESVWRRRHEPERLAEVLLERARVARQAGDPSAALSRTAEALALLGGSGVSVVRAALQELQARLLADAGELAPALESISAALRLDEALRGSVVSHQLRTDLLARRRSRYELEIDLLLRLAEKFPEQATTWRERALAASEKARARSFAEQLAEADLTRDLSLPSEQAAEYERLRRSLEAVQRQWLALAATSPASSPELQRLSARRDQALSELEGAHERLRDHQLRQRRQRLEPPAPPALAEMQKSLEAGDALVEYVLGNQGGAVFVVTPEGLAARRLTVRAGDVERRREAFQSAIDARETRDDDEYREAARWLYEELVAPIEPWLRDRRHLIVVPDGPLHRLSFEALVIPRAEASANAPSPYLLERWTVSYVPSATVRTQLLHQPGGNALELELLALADPPSSTTTLPSTGPSRSRVALALPSLAGARLEVAEIGNLFGAGARVLVAEAASEVAVQTTAAKARYLHFAVHNYFDESRPSAMGLVLAPAGEGDGFLGLAEIESLSLDAELVVLSACDSARGEQKEGEGVLGLVRAFMTAGARNVAVSLWPADDVETPALMAGFYRGVRAGGSRSEALRAAKLALLERGGRAAEPEVWAAFVLFGAR